MRGFGDGTVKAYDPHCAGRRLIHLEGMHSRGHERTTAWVLKACSQCERLAGQFNVCYFLWDDGNRQFSHTTHSSLWQKSFHHTGYFSTTPSSVVMHQI
jgi:hypothetical protein